MQTQQRATECGLAVTLMSVEVVEAKHHAASSSGPSTLGQNDENQSRRPSGSWLPGYPRWRALSPAKQLRVPPPPWSVFQSPLLFRLSCPLYSSNVPHAALLALWVQLPPTAAGERLVKPGAARCWLEPDSERREGDFCL
ncbi:hypothetical protein EYF80_061021 [Liparis tanakae]|uniref:Uncharacterized protein n=1 Tax=Liparis tanakae TaxID=230148 RepID=A0A4Z2EJ50_9TELE|nr:hypothetical protein EYF80_061021 [Liparis tanakae]